MFIGKHVSWQKVKGKPNASMQEKTGFGTLGQLEVGKSMCIHGDYGVYTSVVLDIKQDTDERFPGYPSGKGYRFIEVITKNSVYFVTELS